MTSPENPDIEPEAPRRRSGLIGAGIGVAAIVASLLAFSTLAGAQDSGSELVDPDPAPIESDNGDADVAKFEDAFKDFDTCLADAGVDIPGALGGVFNGVFEGQVDGLFEGEFFDHEFEDKFPLDLGAVVSVMNGDSLSVAEFGDGDGTITITKTGDDISVSSTGDVTVDDIDFDIDGMELDGLDFDLELGELGEEFEAFEDALSSCEDLLPEDLLDGAFFLDDGFFGGEGFNLDHFDLDDFDLDDFDLDDFDLDDFTHDDSEDADVS